MTTPMTNKTGRGRPKTFDRDGVVAAAMTLWWERGPGRLSINELCSTIGMAKPSLYREFGGEDGLMAAVLARYHTTRIDPLLAQLTRERPLADAVHGLTTWLTTSSDLPAGCLLAKARMSLQPLGPEATAKVIAMRDDQIAALGQWMERAAERDELADGVDPKLAGRYLDTQLTALLTLVANAEPSELVAAQTQLAFAGVMKKPERSYPCGQ